MKSFNLQYKSKIDLIELKEMQPEISEKEVLVQIFTSVHQRDKIEDLINVVKDVFPKALIIGTSTIAAIFQGKEAQDVCVMSFSIFEKTKVSIYTVNGEKGQNDYEQGAILANRMKKGNEKVAIAFMEGGTINPEEFLSGIHFIKPQLIVSGGIAAHSENVPFVFTHEGVVEKGIVMAVLESDELSVFNDYNFSWTSIGKSHIATKVYGQVVETIDHLPAKEWYERYIGKDNIQDICEVGVKFPLMIQENNTYIAKPIIGYTDEGGIIAQIGIKEGQEIRLGYGDLNEIIKDCKDLCLKVQEHPIESLFVYSCSARKMYLKSFSDIELSPFFDNINVSGFYCYGEFVYHNNQSMFLSESLVILGLSEDTGKYINVDMSELNKIEQVRDEEQVILKHLIKSTSEELDVFNQSLATKVREQTEQLKSFYYTDELTGLYNINKYKRDLKKYNLDKLALLDIEDFTRINNFYGNQVGDEILKSFAKFIREEIKPYPLRVYRIYSDTFAIAGNAGYPDYDFVYLMKELQDKIDKKSFAYEVHEIYLNVLTGITIKEMQLLEKASLTLDYLRTNKKTLQVYHPILKIEEDIEENMKWVKTIKEAINADRIKPFFQPIYNNKTKKVDKYEALIRLIEEDGTVVSPYYFLPIAKKSNIYPILTRIMLDKTFEVFKDKPYDFSINLTVEDILDGEIRNYIIHSLSSFPYPEKVIFEIVETEGIENFNEVKSFIGLIREYGAKIAIDDFGTGYSNLNYLAKLKVDMIKVDGSIIKNLASDETSNLVAETILHLAKRLGIRTVAEFVENEEIFNKVTELEIDYSQGYYFSMPLERVI